MNRVYDRTYGSQELATNELFSNFKYTPLQGLDYNNGDGTLSRRDATKVVRANGKYSVWYTRRETPTPPSAVNGSAMIPSRDWDLAEIWNA